MTAIRTENPFPNVPIPASAVEVCAISTAKFIIDETKGRSRLLIEKGDVELREIVFR